MKLTKFTNKELDLITVGIINELKKIEAIQPLIDEIYNKDKSAYGLDPDQDTDVFVINFKSKDGNNYALLFRYIKMNQYVTGTGPSPFNRKNLEPEDIEERLSFGQVELYKVDLTLDFLDIKNVEEIYSSNHPIADTAFTPIFDKIAGEIIDLKGDDLRIAMEIESAEYNSDYYADGGGIKKGKELWFSPSGELKTEKKGTAKHYIEQYLAKRFGAESMELDLITVGIINQFEYIEPIDKDYNVTYEIQEYGDHHIKVTFFWNIGCFEHDDEEVVTDNYYFIINKIDTLRKYTKEINDALDLIVSKSFDTELQDWEFNDKESW